MQYMKEIHFSTQSQDTLLGIIKRGFDAVYQTTNQPASEINSLSFQTKDGGNNQSSLM